MLHLSTSVMNQQRSPWSQNYHHSADADGTTTEAEKGEDDDDDDGC